MAATTKTNKKKPNKVTPLMKQYFQIKGKYPDAILLFRVGDFYETFGEDAILASKVLSITLTARNNGGSKIELAGFPHHSMDTYLHKLVRAGYRVAICDQLEKPSKEKKIVKRGVVEVVTPGVTTDQKLLDHKSNNYLASVAFGKKGRIGVSFLDISTGELLVSEGNKFYIDKLLQSFMPNEIIYSKADNTTFDTSFGDKFYTFSLEDWVYAYDYAREKLLAHFKVQTLKGFGVEELELAQIAAGASLYYLSTTENNNLQHLNTISRIEQERYVWLDRFTIRNLELVHSNHESGIPLIQVLDKTISPMGARLLKKWVLLPLKSLNAITARLDMVDYFVQYQELGDEIGQLVQQIGDLERLISRVPLGKIMPREVVQLRKALATVVPMKELLNATANDYLKKLGDGINPCAALKEQIEKWIVEEPPVNLNKGGVIADGVNEELDELRSLIKNSKDHLLNLQKKEAERTGIDNLKIGFNNVFGYYLEVTNKYKNKGLIPDEWTRKQTLTNAERYITEDLKVLESKILTAEERMLVLENDLFQQMIAAISEYIQPIQHNASLIARVDCLLSFSKVAIRHHYCRPQMNEGNIMDIKEGRHPVIEQHLDLGESYVPNDVYLDNDSQQILMITGPNMAGKSAVLRQTALIVLMAQMGSFVPAATASIGIVDKVFTRVGASDNISSGESTFMVEMNETASIMNNICQKSLILLDEIGRGTSTYDGISIAWSIAEYLHNNTTAQPKTLFATHYHELNELANKFPRIKNYNIATKEIDQKVIFLRKLVAGGSHHSFGIHVAKMAGMPPNIVKRATQILGQLEQKSIVNSKSEAGIPAKKVDTKDISTDNYQLNIFETVAPKTKKLQDALEKLDLNAMTPIECMMKLNELKGLL